MLEREKNVDILKWEEPGGKWTRRLGGGEGHLSSRAVQPGTQRQETWILELLLPYFE